MWKSAAEKNGKQNDNRKTIAFAETFSKCDCFLCDQVCKPGSVIDSHLSRRTVAGTFQPPSRKQPGEPCFLCGVAPDRVCSDGCFHTIGCALTAPFHPYLRRGGISLLHFSASRLGRALPVILALWSPDFPHVRPFGMAHATVRPGRGPIVLYLSGIVK